MENTINTIDLSTSCRELPGNSKTNPICLGLQGDMESYTVPFKFTNANIVKGCKCFVQYINADLDEGLQQINKKYSDSFDTDGGEIKVENNQFEINWKPSLELLMANGLVKFSFQFYKLTETADDEDNGQQDKQEKEKTYSFILNTSPIYGYVHNGLVVDQEVIIGKYPTEIAELYDKLDKLIDDGERDKLIDDAESLADIKEYLKNRVPTSIGNTMTEDDIKNLPDNIQFLVAYNPKTNQYSYTPAIKLNDQVIIGNIWNAE